MIAVDRRGRRFVNEADSYHVFVPAMLEATRGDPESKAFLICDHRAIRRYGLGVVPPAPGRMGRFLRAGYLHRGATLSELAASLGVDPQGLERTVSAFNGPAAKGEDPAFGKGRSAYNRSNGDPGHQPNPCVAPLDRPPFYGVVLHPGDIGTFRGLKTDEHARVLLATGEPIEGLYAAGSDMANPMGGTYPGAGVGVGSAMTFGYVAARHAAGLPPADRMASPEVLADPAGRP
jgi:succinate dehydrogenase/fumarate reductase flavoprotein subunit